jgi:hypothetical protein
MVPIASLIKRAHAQTALTLIAMSKFTVMAEGVLRLLGASD